MINLARQPRSVQAITFACVVSYMGIGLVDPILPSIAADLQASPGQTELLFTTYLFTTAVVMFFASWLSSRIGQRTTLLLGLGLVVAFAASCALSGNVAQVIGFRGGWGVGNALFVSTALAAIVGSTSDSRSAIVLYEAALGIGMAVGPLVGGLLGSLSWRGPFAGTALLMGVAALGIGLFLKRGADRPAPVALGAPFRAVLRPDFAPVLVAALLYNYGYFTILAFSPFPLHAAAAELGIDFTPLDLGLVFFGWGVLLAAASVVGAPWLSRTLGLHRTLVGTLLLLAVDEVAFFVGVRSLAVVLAATLVSGALLGIMNTAMTEAAMEATDLPRAVASSSYSGVRFVGAAIAPALTGPLSRLGGLGLPYAVGAGTLLLAAVTLVASRARLPRAHRVSLAEPGVETAIAASIGSEQMVDPAG